MLRNYITMHGATNIEIKAYATHSLGLYEWIHEEYLQPLLQRLQDPNQSSVENLNNVRH